MLAISEDLNFWSDIFGIEDNSLKVLLTKTNRTIDTMLNLCWRELRMNQSDVLIVDHTKSGESQKIFPQPAALSSHALLWKDICLEYHIQPGSVDTGHMVASMHQVIMCLSDTSYPAKLWFDKEVQPAMVHAETISIIPTETTYRIKWEHEKHFLILGFESSWLKRVNRELMNCDHVQPTSKVIPCRDSLIQGILLGLKQGLESCHSVSNIYVEQLKTTLAIYLLRHYSTCFIDSVSCEDGLSRDQLRQVIAYIQANLHQSIKLNDIAQSLNMSQYYFCRLFRDSMGTSPYKYVISQRVKRAKHLLQRSQQQTIADIAIDCGFSSQSHLCKYFWQLLGITPSAYRKSYVGCGQVA
mgnify:CR=1 FL=1